MFEENFNELTDYQPPPWCKGLPNIPKFRIPLVMRPTPIHRWNIEGIPTDVKLCVKRDDMTGSILGGNKGRKMEFLLADAKAKGCSAIITSGSLFSNHCRTAISAARQVGLDCYLIQRDPYEGNLKKESIPSGNLLLVRIGDSPTYMLPWKEFSDENVEVKMKELADHILKTTGKVPYSISGGGTNPVGIHGYLLAWEEMIQQNVLENFDDIVIACGSGGTTRALALANYLTGSKVRIHGISVSRSVANIHAGIETMLKHVGIAGVRPEELVDIRVDYLGAGYSRYNQDDIAFCKKIAQTTGIYCDPNYVGKALKGLITELNEHPERMKGKRILFIHTGGIFGMMESSMAEMFQKEVKNDTKQWEEVFPTSGVNK